MNAIELKGISKEYPGIKALDEINFSVTPKTVHGFLGPNGAGKSTTMKIIAGLIPPTEGELILDGHDAFSDESWAKRLIGYLPETPPLYLNMTVLDYLDFVWDIHQVKSMDGKSSALSQSIERCGLGDVKNRLIGHLSKGYKQRVGIAQALIYDPPILVLDEPTVGLDPNAIVEIRNLIEELKKDHTILLSTHQLHEVAKICDDITFINRGKIISSGTLESFQQSIDQGRVFRALVKNLDEQNFHSLKNIEGVKNIEQADHREGHELRIQVHSNVDLRSQLTKELALHFDLLEFEQVERELEDIFKEVVQ
jgi:ABC-2 type transport system ATP-binding protein